MIEFFKESWRTLVILFVVQLALAFFGILGCALALSVAERANKHCVCEDK